MQEFNLQIVRINPHKWNVSLWAGGEFKFPTFLKRKITN